MLGGGEVTHKLVKVPLGELEVWDQEHDAQGRPLRGEGSSDDEKAMTVDVSEKRDLEK